MNKTMLAVFVFWGLDTEGDAENPACLTFEYGGERVGLFYNFQKMEKLSLKKFEKMKTNTPNQIKGGWDTNITYDSAPPAGQTSGTIDINTTEDTVPAEWDGRNIQ
jgi:hypothetical protein